MVVVDPNAKLCALQPTQPYVMIAPSEIDYVHAPGLLALGAVAGLIAAPRDSRDLQLVAQDGDALLSRFVAGVGATR